jgi:UDP-glucose 4-epimerase
VDAYSDHAKAEQIFGRRASVTLEEGIARMAEWARQVGARKGQEFENIEVRQNLPPSWRG